jgi:hypothetical protein
MDDPEMILKGALENHYKMINEFKEWFLLNLSQAVYRIRFRSDPYYFAGPRSEKIFVLETDPDLHPDPTYWLLWKFRFRELTS